MCEPLYTNCRKKLLAEMLIFMVNKSDSLMKKVEGYSATNIWRVFDVNILMRLTPR